MALDRRAALAGLLRRPLDETWRQMTFDCLVHDATTLEYLVSSHGASRVVVGTNFAAWDQDDHIVDLVRALDIPAADRDGILRTNAARLFRL